MNKKIKPFLIALPALLLLFIFRILPAFNSFVYSIKDMELERRNLLFDNPTAGLRNYYEVFGSDNFTAAVGNTLLLSVLSVIVTCVLALVLILCISMMPGRVLKTIAVIIIAIPAFIPIVSYIFAYQKAFSVGSGFIGNVLMYFGLKPMAVFADPGAYPFLFVLMDSLRNVFVPVIIGVLACESRNGRSSIVKALLVTAGYLAARATMLLSPDLDIIRASSGNFRNAGSVVMDSVTWNFMSGGQVEKAAAIWVLKTVVQLVISVAVYFILCRLSPVITGSIGKPGEKQSQGSGTITGTIIGVIGYLLFAAGSAAVIALTFIPASGTIQGIRYLLGHDTFRRACINTLIYSVCGSIIYGFMALTLAYPMTVSRRVYPFILILISSLANNAAGEYYLGLMLGRVNPMLPVIIYSGLTVIGAFGLHFSVSCSTGDVPDSAGGYFRAALRPLAVITVLSFIMIWGSYNYQYIYISKESLYGLGMFDINMYAPAQVSDTEETVMLINNIVNGYSLITSVIPAAIGAVIIALNKFLPLTAFGVYARKG